DEANLMIRDVTDDETKKALFDIDDNKAPGPDGFTSKFFKKSWDIVKKYFYAAIKDFFTTRKLLVDDNQSAFVPGRAITDNILLTQELLKGYNCANGPKMCSFKINIQKSYDTVLCVNGERYGYFNGGRRLRQGDPISPYIFTVVMEMLNLLIKDEIRKDKSFKYHFGYKQLKITHLCFADDLIMLCHGDMNSVETLKRALDKFSSVSGLYPNLSKCTMFCGSLGDDTKGEISSIFPFKEGKLPVRYLGVPLVTKKIGIADCNQLVEKVRQKLSDRKNKSLSYARRAQLIASVLGSIQVYWGSVFLLPKPVINKIEKPFKRFLWNNGGSSKGKAKVDWLDVCKPKDQGGLGFKSLELWNKTLLVKHLWNITSRKESLWVKSWVGSHMRYKIGDGKSINVWLINGIVRSGVIDMLGYEVVAFPGNLQGAGPFKGVHIAVIRQSAIAGSLKSAFRADVSVCAGLWGSSCGAVSSGWFFVGCTDSGVFVGDCWEELIISCCGLSSLLAVVDRAGLNGLASGIVSGCSVNVGSGRADR
ncbi:RNA-directed DNA polymerase, eukaryota, reverse transcriptase zinc-binding domain protein, partial [Tanacetum coccineum]